MTDLKELKQRLLSKAEVTDTIQCWNWTASTDTHGYGHFKFKGKMKLAHRASYEVHRGPIAPGMQVCHRCDNRACINPSHLFIGTAMDNTRDKLAKNRQSRKAFRGETNPMSRLTADDIRAIRSAEGVKQKVLAERYDVDRAHISQIRSRGRWAHIPD